MTFHLRMMAQQRQRLMTSGISSIVWRQRRQRMRQRSKMMTRIQEVLAISSNQKTHVYIYIFI
jgi:hypothetical protein